MFFPRCRFAVTALLLVTGIGNVEVVQGSSNSEPSTTATSAAQSTGTCEARIINYITDSLPQQCLRKEWNGFNHTGSGNATIVAEAVGGNENITSISATSTTTSIPSTTLTISETAEASVLDLEDGELGDSSFLSFEEWKKQTLEKAGQAHADIGNKKSSDGKKRQSENFHNNLDSFGDEGEIALDFSSFRTGGTENQNKIAQTEHDQSEEDEKSVGKKKDQYRSRDAGKTCKERFSYASFDAGATILKTHPGAKNSKAILIENKDSYMLSICSTQNKFVIIELSEDIWIDTVVLANYEFFSSQIRTFRVSLSDRYPVKADKWKDVGTYEARNTREIQAFLIENPQIWARYIRIEFLTHYGNEYYCPLSLVRVHGTRMLESWKETEASNEEEESEDDNETEVEAMIPEAVAEVIQEEERLKAADDLVKSESQEALDFHEDDAQVYQSTTSQPTTPWIQSNVFELARQNWLDDICLPGDAPLREFTTAVSEDIVEEATSTISNHGTDPNPSSTAESLASSASATTSVSSVTTGKSEPNSASDSSMKASPTPVSSTSVRSSANDTTASPSVGSMTAKSLNVTSTPKNKTTSTTSASSSLPTIQESFFKAVSRRLTLLESNSTLSMKYIEEQSRILREAFTKVEKKQLSKTDKFLDTLNSTVLQELRDFRQQYNEIWQSTIISLESQRDESRKEILAVTSRLNILADEVVFQKRMSIVQSILVLLCLGLVIFTHVSGGGSPIEYGNMSARMRMMSGWGMESPTLSYPQSPEYSRRRPLTAESEWLEVGDRRQRSEDDDMPSGRSRSRRGEDGAATPLSAYTQSEEVDRTPSGRDNDFARIEGKLPALPVENLEVPDSGISSASFFSAPTTGGASSHITYESDAEAPANPPRTQAPIPEERLFQEPVSSPHIEVHEMFGPSSPATSGQQSIPQLEFPEEPVQAPGPPKYSRSTSNLKHISTPSPRFPSPPPEPTRVSESSELRNSTGNGFPLSESGKERHSMTYTPQMPPESIVSTSPPVQAPVSPPTNGRLAPMAKHSKQGSFSIARKPLPALPPDS